MYDFLITATDPAGTRKIQLVNAVDSQTAVAELTEKGFHSLVLHTDDVSAVLYPMTAIKNGMMTPEDMVSSRMFSRSDWFWYLIKKSLPVFAKVFLVVGVPVIALLWWTQASMWAYAWMLICVILSPTFFIWRLVSSGPMSQMKQLAEDFTWGRWKAVLKRAKKLHGNEDLAPELTLRGAGAMAALGRMKEAEELLHSFAESRSLPEWLRQLRLSEVYATTNDDDEVLLCLERARADAPNNPSVEIDYAKALLRRNQNPDLARRLIDSVESKTLSDWVGLLLPHLRGVLMLNSGNADGAVRELEKTMENLQPLASLYPHIDSLRESCRAWLAIAVADSGDMSRARQAAAIARPRLAARNTLQLLRRLDASVPAS